MDSNQFAQTVKQKYPQYAQVPNDVLTQKIVQKYPQYAKAITPGQPQQNPMAQIQPQPAQRPPQQGLGQMDPSAMLKAYARADPQGAQQLLSKLMGSQFGPQDPQKQADLNYTLAQTDKLRQPAKPTSPWRVVPGQLSKNGKPIQQNEQTGEVREASLDVGLQPNARVNASQARTDFLNKSLDYKQRDLLMKGTNLPGQQLKALTQNNMRADRALDLLSGPATWQKMNFALADLAGIMQGGAPHKEEILNSQFPSWKQKVAQYKTFSTGQPTANVPDPIKNEVISMIQSLKKVDNDYLQQNLQNQEQMLGPTIQGFDKIKPGIEQGTQNFMQGTQKPQAALGPTATGPNGKKIRFNGTAWVPM